MESNVIMWEAGERARQELAAKATETRHKELCWRLKGIELTLTLIFFAFVVWIVHTW